MRNKFINIIIIFVLIIIAVLSISMFNKKDYVAEVQENTILNDKIAEGEKFPGKVPDDAIVVQNEKVEVNLDFEEHNYWKMQKLKPLQSTGLYAAPGQEIVIVVPKEITELNVQIGMHTDKLKGKSDEQINRPRDIVLKKQLQPGTNKVMNPYGGIVYLLPTKSSVNKKAVIEISGAVKMPYFVLAKNTDEEWENSLKEYPAPWTELQGERMIITIPTEYVQNLSNPSELLKEWDKIVNEYDKLVGLSQDNTIPDKSHSLPQRILVDLDNSGKGTMHSGYPIVVFADKNKPALVDVETIKMGHWGFLHELGHNYQQIPWRWDEIGETTNNLFGLYIQELNGSKLRLQEPDKRNKGKMPYQEVLKYIQKEDKDKSFNDDKQLSRTMRLVMFYQLRKAYGWQFYTNIYKDYRHMDQNMIDANEKIDKFVMMASKVSGNNLLQFFDKWGLKYSEETKIKVEAFNLPKPDKKIWLLELQ